MTGSNVLRNKRRPCSALNSVFIIPMAVSILYAGVANEFFVSPSGDDSWSGTARNEPFATLERARDAVREVNSDMNDDIVVTLLKGRYVLENTLVLDDRDGATNGHKIIYRADEQHTAHISGGVQITGWEIHDEGNNIWKASVEGLGFPDGGFRQFYVNGLRCMRARQPNLQPRDKFDTHLGDENTDYWRSTGVNWNSRSIQVSASQAGNWQRLQHVEINYLLNWVCPILRIENIQFSGGSANILPQLPERNFVFDRSLPQVRSGIQYCFFNAYEFLDDEGEWYLNRDTDELFYIPRDGEQMDGDAIAVAPRLDPILRVEPRGSSPDKIKNSGQIDRLDNIIEGLEFNCIIFEYSTWMRPTLMGGHFIQGDCITLRDDGNDVTWTHRCSAALIFVGVHNSRIERCVVRHTGAVGIDLYYGCENNVINGCVITDASASGIMVADFSDESMEMHEAYLPADPRRITRNIEITNNLVTYCARDYKGSQLISVGYTDAIKIEHNQISNAPYIGITLGWGWRQFDTEAGDNMVRYNIIHDVVQFLYDAAGVYTLGKQPGTRITDNCLFNIYPYLSNYPLVFDLYLDEGSTGITVENNRTYNTVRPGTVNQNVTGTCFIGQNGPGIAESVCDNAGIQSEYADILDFPDDDGTAPEPDVGARTVRTATQAAPVSVAGSMVRFFDRGGKSLTVMSLDGKVVYTKTVAPEANCVRLDGAVPAGTYILEVSNNGGAFRRKISLVP